MGQISCFQSNELQEYNVLLIGPSGSGKTTLVSKKTLGPTIKLEKHLVKVNDTHGLNIFDTPGIMSIFQQCVNIDVLQSVDIIACFNNSDPYKQYIKDILSTNSKLLKSIPFFDIPDKLESSEIINKIYMFILASSKRKSKKPSYNQEIV